VKTALSPPLPRPRCPQPDTAVATARPAAAGAMTESPEESGTWRAIRALAPALLCLLSAACFNPTYLGKTEPRENHVPIVEAFPPPSFEPLQADVGEGCAPLSIPITTLDDADGDILTVRFDALVNRNGRAARVELRESPPISPSEEGEYPLTALTTLVLDEELLAARLGDLERQMDPRNNLTQLIELRVSDTGFVTDENGDPVADGDGGLVFLSWMIRLTECGVEP
jgi:hypothetical protein